MKNKVNILVAVFLAICSLSFSDQPESRELKLVRSGFYAATQNSEKAQLLLIIIEKLESKSPIIKAYEGANITILAKTKWNPFTAIRLIKKSRRLINAAVLKAPKNLEIRFIRFAVQKNIPAFLNLSENMEEDKKFIINTIEHFDSSVLNKNMKSYILNFIIEQGGYTEVEMLLIKEKLS